MTVQELIDKLKYFDKDVTPIALRRISKQGWALTNCCWYHTTYGVPMVGSTFCKTNCPHYKGTMRLLFWKFVKCSRLI